LKEIDNDYVFSTEIILLLTLRIVKKFFEILRKRKKKVEMKKTIIKREY
jgi:hypothetical protein